MTRYAFDFETNNDEDDCHVWVWGVMNIDDFSDYHYGYTVESCIEFMNQHNGDYYAHNAGFDSEFIIWSLLYTFGFEHSLRKRGGTFNLVMSDMRKFYQCDIIFSKSKQGTSKVSIKDSMKKMPGSLDYIAKSYGLGETKGTIDYDKKRPKGYKPTDEEMDYLYTDCYILAQALRLQFDEGLDALTIGSDALKKVKEKFNFRKVFPVLSLQDDAYIRKAYKGGFTYANPNAINKIIEGGIVLDKHSMYPSKMLESLPIGTPNTFDGRYIGKKMYIQSFYCTAKLKEGKIPTIQIKGSFFRENEYLTLIEEPTLLHMTKIDLEMFFDHYEVDVIEWCGGMTFHCGSGMFDDFIYYWYERKRNAEKGSFEYELCKYMLNNPYGKLATNPDVTGRFAETCAKGTVQYTKFSEQEFREPVATAAGAWITALARQDTISVAQRNIERYLYSDTDSNFFVGATIPKNITITDDELGTWGLDYEFTRLKIIRQKTYIAETAKGMKVKCAGLRSDKRKELNFDNFSLGLVVPEGKTRQKHVPGGVIIQHSDFTLL